jgi:hypothetical protein
MTSITIGVVSTACVFGGGLIGLALQRFLPKHHLSKESQDLVKLGAGVIATITALVLGLLVSSAKSSFDAMNTRIMQAGASAIILDRMLAEYGPDAKNARDQLRRSVEESLHRIWPSERTGVSGSAVVERGGAMEAVQAGLRQLAPRKTMPSASCSPRPGRWRTMSHNRAGCCSKRRRTSSRIPSWSCSCSGSLSCLSARSVRPAQRHDRHRLVHLCVLDVGGDLSGSGDEPAAGRIHQGLERPHAQSSGVPGPVDCDLTAELSSETIERGQINSRHPRRAPSFARLDSGISMSP